MRAHLKPRIGLLLLGGFILLCVVVAGPVLFAGTPTWQMTDGTTLSRVLGRSPSQPCALGLSQDVLTSSVHRDMATFLWLVLDCATINTPPPTNLDAHAEAGGVRVNWTVPPVVTGIHHYEVWRTCDKASTLVSSVQPPETTFLETFPSGPVAGFVYRVRTVDHAGNVSPFSNSDLAVTQPFLEAVTAQVTPVRAQHVTELRDDVNAVRACAGLPAVSWAESIIPFVTTIYASHIQEMRNNVNPARIALGLPAQGWTDEPLGHVLIHKQHLDELRSAVQ